MKEDTREIFQHILSGAARESYDSKGWTEKAFNEVLAALSLTLADDKSQRSNFSRVYGRSTRRRVK